MGRTFDTSRIERVAERLGLLSDRTDRTTRQQQRSDHVDHGDLDAYPPPSKWDDWLEYDATGDPTAYSLVPTACFNCEAGCGLLAYINRETGDIEKFEGNPEHPGSRGRNCAKGVATLNQINDPKRITHPLKRDGPRGSGEWTRVSWEEALEDIAGEMRAAITDGRENEITYHVGRPGYDGSMDRTINGWGLDGHNSHTNICSSGARTGYGLWHRYDRPSADYANADFILLLSAQLESGHYFNPHAQRIIDSMDGGGELAVMDPRLSNTAAVADHWMPTQPGSEAAVLLAMARVLLEEDLYDATFLRNWTNWKQFLDAEYPDVEYDLDVFVDILLDDVYTKFTPAYAADESGVEADTIRTVARKIGHAAPRYASHIWRSASAGNEGGWQVSRTLHFLSVLTGSVGTEGGTSPNGWHKYEPEVPRSPPRQQLWDELQLPTEYPFAHYEMSQLLPYFLKEGRGKLSVYFTRVFNPVYTYPDGFSWIEVLQDPEKIGLHVALTPTWNETAYFADYVLPMGHSPERHDIQSSETHAGTWVTFRQPVHRRYAEREGEDVERTHEVNPGEVWEEDEFWLDLSWRIDEDGELGIREYFESPYRGDEDDPVQMTVEEYYRYVFEHDDRLQEVAAEADMDPLEYMKRYGAFEASDNDYRRHEESLDPSVLDQEDVFVDEYGTIRRQPRSAESTQSVPRAMGDGGQTDRLHSASDGSDVLGVMVEGEPKRGFPTPTGKQQFYSKTMAEWEWDDQQYTLPHYIKSHVHPDNLDYEAGEMVLVPTFRLPTQIHSRSSNAKYLEEISHSNPVWIHTRDAERLGLTTGDLCRVETDIGYFVNEVWVTESIKPGIVAMSHHMGQWEIDRDADAGEGGDPYGKVSVDLRSDGSRWGIRQTEGIAPFESDDPDSERVWWDSGGVPQNLTHAPHPDPISGMHCWHQKVTVTPAADDDAYGDVFVDTERSFEIYQEWLEKTSPAPGPEGLRRPKWLKRPIAPPTEAGSDAAWYVDGPVGRPERWSNNTNTKE